jgi:methyl coenzyme M reductase beta subunit
MDYAPIFVAGIAAVGAIMVAIIQQFRRENRDDHAKVMDVLDRVSHTVDRVEGKVDSHLQWHIEETGNGRVPRRVQARASKATKRK